MSVALPSLGMSSFDKERNSLGGGQVPEAQVVTVGPVAALRRGRLIGAAASALGSGVPGSVALGALVVPELIVGGGGVE